jgi:hypothetical protein
MNRNFRLWTVLTAVVALGTLALSACGVTTSKTQPSASASATMTKPPKAVGPFCAVPMPAVWKSAIANGQVTADGTWSRVFALAPNGEKIVKEVLKDSVAHLEVGAPGGKQQFITNIANTKDGGFLASADFDGRWVVYVLTYAQQVANPWAVYAWDSQSAAAPHKIASSRLGSSAADPRAEVYQGKTNWITGGVTQGMIEIHLFDLASNHDQLVTKGFVGAPFFVDGLLVWPESKDGFLWETPVKLKAYDIASSTMSNLTDALKAVKNDLNFVSDGRTSAWTDRSLHQLSVWQSGWLAPRDIFYAGPGGEWVGSLNIAGRFVTWTGNATYAADLGSGSYVKLTPEYGSSIAKGNRFTFVYNTTPAKSQYIPNVSVVLDVSKLPPLPACALSK